MNEKQDQPDRSRIMVTVGGQTVWLTQAMLADLYETTPQTLRFISRRSTMKGI